MNEVIVKFNNIDFYSLDFTKEYLISKCGLILSLPKYRNYGDDFSGYLIMKPKDSYSFDRERLYKRVGLSIDSKTKMFFIHKILAKTFLKNENNYKHVVFKDGNTFNISLDNLCFSYSSNKFAKRGANSYNKYVAGVSFVKRNTSRPFLTRIMKEGKRKIIGHFKTLEEAQSAYLKELELSKIA